MHNCGNQARVRASVWWLSCMKQDQTHTRLYKPAVGIHISVVVRTHNYSHEILSWLKPGGHDFIWSCFIYRTISQQNNRGQCILTFIFTSPQVDQPPACFVLDIYECVCVCVLPWTAHTAGPPSLDSSGLRSCSVSPWTSHWNTRREKTSDFNSRLKVWCERRVMCHIQVLRHKLHVNIVKKLLLLRFFFLFSRRCRNYLIIIWLKVQPVIQISLHQPLWPHLRPVQPDPKVTTPGCCCCPRRVSGGFTKEIRLLQISPPASISEEL